MVGFTVGLNSVYGVCMVDYFAEVYDSTAKRAMVVWCIDWMAQQYDVGCV